MKSFRNHQCEQLLIYDHDDLSNLHIEINFLKAPGWVIVAPFQTVRLLPKIRGGGNYYPPFYYSRNFTKGSYRKECVIFSFSLRFFDWRVVRSVTFY